MKQEIIQIELKASMQFTSLQWRNQTRLFFENWAMKIASEHCVLLENISRCPQVWSWYQAQFSRIERNFYESNKSLIKNLDEPNELFELFKLFVFQMDNYPLTLIQNLKHGETAVN